MRVRTFVVLAVVLAGGLAGSATAGVTSAAWANPAFAAANVTTGTWQPSSTCTVRTSTGAVDPSKGCTVTKVEALFWGSAGAGQGSLYAEFSAPGIGVDQYVAFDLAIPVASKPAWWSWATSSITGINNNGAITSACNALPQVAGREGANIGETPNVYLNLSDQRPAGRLCS